MSWSFVNVSMSLSMPPFLCVVIQSADITHLLLLSPISDMVLCCHGVVVKLWIFLPSTHFLSTVTALLLVVHPSVHEPLSLSLSSVVNKTALYFCILFSSLCWLQLFFCVFLSRLVFESFGCFLVISSEVWTWQHLSTRITLISFHRSGLKFHTA